MWYNIKTGERRQYNSNEYTLEISSYRSITKPTEWRIVFESLEGEFPIPRFLDPSDPRSGFIWF